MKYFQSEILHFKKNYSDKCDKNIFDRLIFRKWGLCLLSVP